MVSSSSIAIPADGEHLAYGGFSVSKPIHLGNLVFITDYFGGLSLSSRMGDEGTAFMGSTHSGASTLRQAMIEDSTEEFLMASSGEGSFILPSPGRCGGFARSYHNHTMAEGHPRHRRRTTGREVPLALG
jgi:hypothetical protein